MPRLARVGKHGFFYQVGIEPIQVTFIVRRLTNIINIFINISDIFLNMLSCLEPPTPTLKNTLFLIKIHQEAALII